MAIRTKDEIIESFNSLIGENTSDEALAFLEDVSDTMDSFADVEDWKTKYDDLDKEWRKRYKERFMAGSDELPTGEKIDEGTHDEIKDEIVTYDDFFESIKVDNKKKEEK